MNDAAPATTPLLASWLADPFAGWTALAAIVAAAAAWSGGLLRGDVRAFRRPRAWTAIALATASATAIAAGLTATGAEGDPTAGVAVRVPAFFVALLLGPSPGALTAALASGVDPTVAGDPGRAAVRVLEAALVGWIALAPDPRRRRAAAGLAVAGGWGLATVTAGLSAAALAMPAATPWALAAPFGAPAIGIAAVAVACALVPPRIWRWASDSAGGTLRDEAREDPLVVPPLVRDEPRRWSRLAAPPRPGGLPRPLALRDLPVGRYDPEPPPSGVAVPSPSEADR